MSNVKDINLEARVPYWWMQPRSEWDPEGLSAEDVAFVASLLLGPATGFHYDYRADGYDDNDRGGRTAMYRVQIYGTEALSYPGVERLVEIIEKAGTVTTATALDLEDGISEVARIR